MARQQPSSPVRTATIEQLETRTNLSGTPVMIGTVDVLGTVVSATDPRIGADRLDVLLQEARRLSDAKELEEISTRLLSRELFDKHATPPGKEWTSDPSWTH